MASMALRMVVAEAEAWLFMIEKITKGNSLWSRYPDNELTPCTAMRHKQADQGSEASGWLSSRTTRQQQM